MAAGVIATGIQGKLALGMLAIIGLAAGMVMGALLTYFEYRLRKGAKVFGQTCGALSGSDVAVDSGWPQ